MPVAHINVLKGHSRESLKQLIGEVSEKMAEILGAPKDRLQVWVTEVDAELWGVGGVPAAEAMKDKSLAETEMPLIQMVLMEGRSKEQHHALIEALTEITARVLQTRKERIRLHIADAQPDKWGIGGVPYSVKRAAEMVARKEQTA